MKLYTRLLYAGTNRELYNRLKPSIIASNRTALRLYSTLGMVVLAGLFIASFFEPSLVKVRVLYIALFTGCCAVCGVAHTKKYPLVIQAATLLFIALLLFFGIAIGTIIDPESLSIVYTVFLFIVPQLFCERPLSIMLTCIVSMIVYFMLASIYQTPQMLSYNATNVLPFGALGLMLCPYIINLKLDHVVSLADSNSIETLLPATQAHNSVKLENMVGFMLLMLNYHTDESPLHCKRVTQYSRLLCEAFNKLNPPEQFTDSDKELLCIGAQLHDIGTIYIPDELFRRTGSFTDSEWEIFKNHTVVGSKLAAYISQICDVKSDIIRNISRSHHERWDGSGYPDKLSGNDIPLEAQLVALAEVYDSLTSENYSARRSHGEAYRMINEGECGAFNPRVLEAFRAAEQAFKKEAENAAASARKSAAV